MARFLTTKGISYFFDELFKTSQKFVYIVSPYIKLDKQLVERIQDSLESGLNIVLIFGKDKRQLETLDPIILDGLNIHFYQDLHAKFYMNENELLIASMNLYKYSEAYNREVGVLFTKSNNEDTKVIEECLKEFKSILKQSEKINAENQEDSFPRIILKENERINIESNTIDAFDLIKKVLQKDNYFESEDVITNKLDLVKDLHFEEWEIEEFINSLEYELGFDIDCDSTLIESIEKYINEYNWEDQLSKQQVLQVKSYEKQLNEKYNCNNFKIAHNGLICRDNFPNESFDFDTHYGFASFYIKDRAFDLRTLQEKIYAELNSTPNTYRVYVKKTKITAYSKKDFEPASINEENEYYITGVNNLVKVLSKISSQIK